VQHSVVTSCRKQNSTQNGWTINQLHQKLCDMRGINNAHILCCLRVIIALLLSNVLHLKRHLSTKFELFFATLLYIQGCQELEATRAEISVYSTSNGPSHILSFDYIICVKLFSDITSLFEPWSLLDLI
jgi:hypothetical protein